MIVLCYYHQCNHLFNCPGACQASFLTEEVDADAMVTSESVTPARCIKCRLKRREDSAAQFCVN